ncbi:MAG: PilZ domain-containing protein [Candidatus Competibacteraceae bacterium]
MTNPVFPEKRNLQRWHLFLYLRVFDQQTGELLGNLVDISESGLMMISDQPIPKGKAFDLWVDVPHEEGERERLHLKAHSRWSGKDVNPDFYDNGFQIDSIDLLTLAKIQQLINKFRFYK